MVSRLAAFPLLFTLSPIGIAEPIAFADYPVNLVAADGASNDDFGRVALNSDFVFVGASGAT